MQVSDMKKGFILFVGLLSITAAFYFVTTYHTQKPIHTKVIVVGAGISGISAAHYLAKQHIPLLVLEARNRIGGRINTVYPWGPGLDLGASWIHGIEHNPIAELSKQLHLTIVPTYYGDNTPYTRFNSYLFYDSHGKHLPNQSIQKALQLSKQFDDYLIQHKNALVNTTVESAFQQFTQQNHIANPDYDLLHYIVTVLNMYEYAYDLTKLSANMQLCYAHSVVGGKNDIFPYGYNQLLPELTKDLPILLNQKVKKIVYNKDKVDVYTQDTHYQADHVIITVPLGVLKSGKITFVPALPKEKQQLIDQLSMAVYDKIYLYFSQPFWDKESEWIGYIPEKYNLNHTLDILNYYKYTKSPILLFFTGGSRAIEIEHWSDQKTIHYLMSVLQKIYGPHIPQPTSYVITRWYQDPYTYGSYSYLPAKVQIDAFARLAKPIANQLFFAGEATSETDPATVHGAYLTGIRAAKEVMASDLLSCKKYAA